MRCNKFELRQNRAWCMALAFLLLVGGPFYAQDTLSKEEVERRLPEGASRYSYHKIPADGSHFTQARVVPDSWWIGMEDPQVEVILYDKGIATGKARVEYKGVSVVRSERLESPNYLFVTLDVSESTRPGIVQIEVKNGKKVQSYAFELLARDKTPGRVRRVGNSDVMYLIMPDRFANGDSRNDVLSTLNQHETDRRRIYYRHGGDLQGVLDHLDYLQDLGVSALWLNPVQENNQFFESYHGYAITDHYRVDPRLGSNGLYKNLGDACQQRGMALVMDLVFNHIGSQHWMFQDPATEKWYHWWPEFTRSNYRETSLMDPYGSEADRKKFSEGWFDSDMPDIDQSEVHLQRYFIQNSLWWIEYAGVDAFRVDTYTYPDQDFMAKWADAVRRQYPDFYIFGECWVHGPAIQRWFAEGKFGDKPFDSRMNGLMDFQLYHAFSECLSQDAGWTNGISRLYLTLAQDFLYPEGFRQVTFLDNHDCSRFFSVVGEDDTRLKSGLLMLLTLRGIPCLYYGTEVGMKGLSNPDGYVRLDFPGGWPGDAVDHFTGKGRSPLEEDVFQFTRSLVRYRQQHPALHSGLLKQFVPQDGVYVYFRYDDSDRFLVAVNTSKSEVELDLSRFSEMLSGKRVLKDVLKGRQQELGKKLVLKAGEGVLGKVE